MSIDGETTYSKFFVELFWQENGSRNCTCWDLMFLDNIPLIVVRQLSRERWTRMINQQTDSVIDPETLQINCKPLPPETWCLGWFSHWTFDIGQSDKDVLESFERFVRRAEIDAENRGERELHLMSAEDRHRWHGTKDGSPDMCTDPPCRCIYCKRLGVITIGH